MPVPWSCPSCGTMVHTPFCSGCGERPLVRRDLSMRGLFDQLARAVSSLDARGVRSLRCLVVHPGALTQAYLRGQRKPYLGPLQIFLVANVLFFVVQWATAINIFSSSLDSHRHAQDWSVLAQELTARRLQATHRTLDAYAPTFDRAAVINAKSLIIVMTVPFALLLPLLFHASHKPLMAHAVFALHLYAFLLVLFTVAVGIAALSVMLGGPGLDSPAMDHGISVVNLLACGAYLHTATGRVYDATGAMRVLKVAVLTFATAAIVLGYRFVVFLVTLYGT